MYIQLIEKPYGTNTSATMIMDDPDHYSIYVKNASVTTAVIVKMTHDSGFTARVNGKKVPITSIGPDFMLISPILREIT